MKSGTRQKLAADHIEKASFFEAPYRPVRPPKWVYGNSNFYGPYTGPGNYGTPRLHSDADHTSGTDETFGGPMVTCLRRLTQDKTFNCKICSHLIIFPKTSPEITGY